MPDFVWIQEVVFPILGMGMGALVLTGVYKLVRQTIDRRHERLMAQASGGVSSAALEQLRARIDVLEDAALRMQELEERVDFAERLLTREREHPRLPQ